MDVSIVEAKNRLPELIRAVEAGEHVVITRHGKPVEVNAMWYNCLLVMAEFAEMYREDPAPYAKLAATVKREFNRRFWNVEKGCMYDVLRELGARRRKGQLLVGFAADEGNAGPDRQ